MNEGIKDELQVVRITVFVILASVLLLFSANPNWQSNPKVHRPWRQEVKLIQQWSYVHSEGKIASWYGQWHHGRTMANGKKYNMYGISVAHKTLKFGTVVKVTNLKNGLFVYAKVTDRGPYIKGRVVDMSFGAAKVLKMVRTGIVPCRVEIVRGLGGRL
jgi:rare lipoprotein A (peptidoglycan hydrolase)